MPPYMGGVQSRVRVCIPGPHFAEHALYDVHAVTMALTAHFLISHDLVSTRSPLQAFPPYLGPMHRRRFICVPSPHTLEQVVNALH